MFRRIKLKEKQCVKADQIRKIKFDEQQSIYEEERKLDKDRLKN